MQTKPNGCGGVLHDQPQPLFVYFIQGENGGPIKIGVATDPQSRCAELQTGNPMRLVVRKTLIGGYGRERELHLKFAAQRMAGEWFAPTRELCEAAHAPMGALACTDEVAAIKRAAYLKGREEGIKRGMDDAIAHWDEVFKASPLIREMHMRSALKPSFLDEIAA